ncbi:MAG: DUF6240 domain-containing protein [Lachnospiraceae bacterium]|nr:DUF6240 domain-containing protein [Lachnospiraceae bacterium]
MKITFQNIELNNDAQMMGVPGKMSAQNSAEMGKKAVSANVKNGIRLDVGNSKRGMFTESAGGKNGIGITELQQQAGAIDNKVDRNYRAVMSNTMSGADYAKAQKEGYDYGSMDPEDVVTIQDKLKAELAKSGVIIAGYNDNMDSNVLAEAVGSDTLARDIKGSEELAAVMMSAYTSSNLPVTEENVENLEKAWSLVSELKQPSEGNVAYMIENDMRPTVWNFYLAENSGAANTTTAGLGFDTFEVSNAMDKNDTIVRQIEGIIAEARLNTDETTHMQAMADAQWLLNNNLPITVESLTNLEDIKSVEFPVRADRFIASAVAAVADGKEPIHADLTKTESVYAMAARLEEKYFSDDIWEATAGDITARRQLEEIRLSMTAEVNVKLIQSGFSIDTQPMEQLIDALKEAELRVADRYFDKYTGSGYEAIGSYRLMNATNKAVQEIAASPAATLGIFTTRNVESISLSEFHSESVIARDTYIRAGESYEALMTAPRADLGDKIAKAFEGVGSLLDSLGIEVSDSSLRAARILGYNSMEVTAENIDRIIYADRMVQSVVEKMTPASVLQMIREGVNPLENDFAGLSKYLSDINKDEYRTEAKEYSEFLYGLDMQDAITAEERESFIGIYRMLHQIEKADGAAIGAVINERAELDFNNLISAARSNRLKGIDIKVNAEYGMTEELYTAANSITDQIATAFIGATQKVEIEQLRESVNTDADVTGMLEQFNMPASAENMSAMERLISVDDNLFEDVLKFAAKADKKDNANVGDGSGNKTGSRTNIGSKTGTDGRTNIGSYDDVETMVADIEEALGTDSFEEKVEQFGREMDSFTKELTFEADSYIDVKSLSLIHLQLGMVTHITEHTAETGEGEFIIPYDTGVGIAKAHIAFKNGEKGAPAKLDIKAQMAEGVAELHISLNDNRLEGYFVGNTKDELQKMESISDILIESLKANEGLSDLMVEQIPVFTREGEGTGNLLSETKYQSKDADGLHSEGTEKKVLLQVAKIFLQSVRRA